mgnify:CR=1 FL=1
MPSLLTLLSLSGASCISTGDVKNVYYELTEQRQTKAMMGELSDSLNSKPKERKDEKSGEGDNYEMINYNPGDNPLLANCFIVSSASLSVSDYNNNLPSKIDASRARRVSDEATQHLGEGEQPGSSESKEVAIRLMADSILPGLSGIADFYYGVTHKVKNYGKGDLGDVVGYDGLKKLKYSLHLSGGPDGINNIGGELSTKKRMIGGVPVKFFLRLDNNSLSEITGNEVNSNNYLAYLSKSQSFTYADLSDGSMLSIGFEIPLGGKK